MYGGVQQQKLINIRFELLTVGLKSGELVLAIANPPSLFSLINDLQQYTCGASRSDGGSNQRTHSNQRVSANGVNLFASIYGDE